MQHVIFETLLKRRNQMAKNFPHFIESTFYKIEQIARYLEVQGKDFIEKLTNNQLSAEEFRTLDVIMCNPDICQRDLAKLILRDRVRTGRILDSLENKGLILRFSDTKNNRLVKKMELTKTGTEYFETISAKMQPYLQNLMENFTIEQGDELNQLLDLLHQALSETVKIKV